MESSELLDIVVRKAITILHSLVCGFISGYGRDSTIYGHLLYYQLNYLGKYSSLVGICLPAGIETEHSVGYSIILSNQLLLDYKAHGKNILWV